MDKENIVHIYNGILLSHKKNKIMSSAATWMQPECYLKSYFYMPACHNEDLVQHPPPQKSTVFLFTQQ